MGVPVAIFSESMPMVVQHSFEVNGQDGIEIVTLRNDGIIEFYQSGCDKLKQEFRFINKGNFTKKSNEYWIERAAAAFFNIATFAPRLEPFGQWADIIQKSKRDIKLGEPFYPDFGIQIIIDKIVSREESKLFISIEQK